MSITKITFIFFLAFILSSKFIILIGQELNLPKGFSEKELLQMPDYIKTLKDNSTFSMFSDRCRTPAEWEEMQAIFISWKSYPSILKEIVRNAMKECKVIIAANDTNSVKSYLEANAINPSQNISYLKYNTNSVWMRDYGPNSVYLDGIDSLTLVDWIYNRPRPSDDSFSVLASRTLNLPLFQTLKAPLDLVHTGGNFMSDGAGQAFSSSLVEDENGPNSTYGTSVHTVSEINNILNSYMGISNYAIMSKLPYDGIHHIDMHMKLLDESTLLVGQYPIGIADGPQIEANIQYVLSNYKTKSGNPFKVYRIPMPPDINGNYPDQKGSYRTYANALIINKSILIPTYELKYDSIALRIWKSIMPGYNVVGINCESMISASGAIHCITKELGTTNPLLIQHISLDDIKKEDNSDYKITATIQHNSGISEGSVFYKLKNEINFTELKMIQDNNDPKIWSAIIPMQAVESEIQYYISSTANNGKSQFRPMPAPESYFKFKILNITSSQNIKNVFEQKLFPNPAKAITCIPTTLSVGKKIRLNITDLMGKEVKTIFQGIQQNNDQKYFFNASELLSGVYLVNLTTMNISSSQILIVE
ncbi:MAG: agmatine deiminase family protein, partial [Saprospiraceae bacterium]